MARIAKKGTLARKEARPEIKPEYRLLLKQVSDLRADQWCVLSVPEGVSQATYRNRIAMVLTRRLPSKPVRVLSLKCGREIAVELK